MGALKNVMAGADGIQYKLAISLDLQMFVDNLRKGRSGKQKRLREIANDDKVSSVLNGEIKRDINEIKRGKRKNIRIP